MHTWVSGGGAGLPACCSLNPLHSPESGCKAAPVAYTGTEGEYMFSVKTPGRVLMKKLYPSEKSDAITDL